MKKIHIILIVVLSTIAALLLLFFIGKSILFPKYKEIELTGEYDIKSYDYWVTEEIEDPYLSDGSLREIQVRIWYPDNYKDAAKLPVVVASHGSCGSIDNNLSLYKELASHGYTVLALAHPGQASEMVHSNGKKQSVSMEFLKEMVSMNPQDKPEDTAVIFSSWMEIRMTDLSYVMDDFIRRVNEEPDSYKSADTNRYITLGHSLGGSAALGMARIRDDVIGVIALESPFMYDIQGVEDGEYIFDDSDYLVPILHIYSDSSYSRLREWEQYKNNVKFLDSDDTRYENIYYQGTGHMGLCDLSLASPVLSSLIDTKIYSVKPHDQLKKLNEDCMNFVLKISQDENREQ